MTNTFSRGIYQIHPDAKRRDVIYMPRLIREYVSMTLPRDGVYRVNNTGPSTDPGGTPDSSGLCEEGASPMRTHWKRSLR